MDYSLALAFDTDSPDFARGVEIGRLWEQLDRAHPADMVEQVVHVANAEMVLRIAEARGRAVSSDEHDGTWMTVRFAAAVPHEASL